MALFYYEQMTFCGDWTPRVSDEMPVVKSGRVKMSEGFGHKIRNVQEIPAYMRGAQLEDLQEYFGKKL